MYRSSSSMAGARISRIGAIRSATLHADIGPLRWTGAGMVIRRTERPGTFQPSAARFRHRRGSPQRGDQRRGGRRACRRRAGGTRTRGTHPALVRAVVMVDAGVYPKPRISDSNDPFGARLGQMVDALSSPARADRFAEIYATFFAPHAARSLVKRTVADALRTPLPVAIAELRRTIGANTQAMGKVRQAAGAVRHCDGCDQLYVRSVLRNVQFGQVVGSGHFVQLEVPAQLNAMIDTFVRQLD